MRKWICGILCLLLCAPCALGEEIPDLMEPVGVQLNAVEAHIGEISKIAVYPGSVVPYVQEFFFEQEGVIDVMHVVAGQFVHAGDPLITLDTEAEAKRIQQLQKEMEQLKANAAFEDQLAEIDLAMLETELRALKKQTPADAAAVQLKQLDIEEQKLAAELAARLRRLELDQMTAELQLLEEELEKNVLYAPFDGRVVYMSAEWRHGDYVSAFTPLIYLADDTQLFVESGYISDAALSSAHAVYARVGSERYAVTETKIDDREYLAKVLAGEELTRQFTFDQADEQLSAGQYAVICVESSYQADALLVPTNALYSADKVRYLYVMENGVRVRRDVKTGITTDWYTQITEGLEEGELVYVQE